MTTQDVVTWAVAGIATAGVILRPFRLPEALWAVLGAAILVVFGLLPWPDALTAIGKGVDVYLFLTGMMLLSELARQEGLFDYVAARAARLARGSARRLFVLVYGVGTIVTAFLSNDATAVVLTPAVYAATRAAKADPLPYLLVCALIANAASFLLPISNPANLVLYASHLPPLPDWVGTFLLPSVVSIGATYVALRLVQRRALRDGIEAEVSVPPLSAGGRTAAAAILVTAAILLTASALDWQLGLPTAAAGVIATAAVCIGNRLSPLPILRHVSWGVIPLVAGLFVLVEALAHTGVIGTIAGLLHEAAASTPRFTAWAGGIALAFGCNLTNNLPAGLIASSSLQLARPPRMVTDALLIGVDLGPNLSVTGSLATILWLIALRREGIEVGFWQFLRVGAVVMPPALVLALAALLVR